MFKWFSTIFSLGAPVKSSGTVDEKKLVSLYSTPFEIQVYFYSKTLDINKYSFVSTLLSFQDFQNMIKQQLLQTFL